MGICYTTNAKKDQIRVLLMVQTNKVKHYPKVLVISVSNKAVIPCL